jgi:hypothetical protein
VGGGAVSATHACPGKCGQQVGRAQLACRADWYQLPADLRAAVNLAYRRRAVDPAGHLQAVRDALEWCRLNPRAVAP